MSRLYNPILLVTVISIIIGPNTLTVLLELILISIQWQFEVNVWEELPTLGLKLPDI